jgi:hypothetical protein
MPFAFAWRSTGTSSVTVVESAMLRRFSITAPNRMMPVNSQNHGPVMSTSTDSGWARYSAPATRNDASVTRLERIMTRCLRWRSTSVPNTIEIMPKNATSSMYAPPMTPVASTDLVSRYTQNVSANHRKLVVTFAAAVLTSTWKNVRMPFGGGTIVRCRPVERPGVSEDMATNLRRTSDRGNPEPCVD